MRPDYKNAIDFSDNGIGSIGSIYITGGGFVNREFKGITPNSAFGWNEFVWAKTPNRSNDFSFQNIDKIDVGVVARCEITIGYMDIQDYMDLRQILTNERHFFVRFFNKDTGSWMTRDMYCSEQSLRQLYTLNQLVIGGFELTLKFVGTNLDVNRERLSITYNANGGTGSIPSVTNKMYSEQVTLDSGSSLTRTGYSLKGFNTKADGTGWAYLPNQSITLFQNLTLYAQWQ